MKKSTIQVLSFVSGLTIAAVVIGVTISKSPSLQAEIEHQVNSCLKATRSLVDIYKSLVSKSKTATSLIKTESGESIESEEAAAEQASQVNDQWDAVEEVVAQ